MFIPTDLYFFPKCILVPRLAKLNSVCSIYFNLFQFKSLVGVLWKIFSTNIVNFTKRKPVLEPFFSEDEFTKKRCHHSCVFFRAVILWDIWEQPLSVSMVLTRVMLRSFWKGISNSIFHCEDKRTLEYSSSSLF